MWVVRYDLGLTDIRPLERIRCDLFNYFVLFLAMILSVISIGFLATQSPANVCTHKKMYLLFHRPLNSRTRLNVRP